MSRFFATQIRVYTNLSARQPVPQMSNTEMNSDYIYVCCQITPTIIDHITTLHETVKFKRAYFAIPPFNMHYYHDKYEMSEHVKSAMSYIGVKYFFIDQPCFAPAVNTDIFKIISNCTSLSVSKNEFLIEKIVDKTELLYKYDIRSGTTISDKVYHNMWACYRAKQESEWKRENKALQWSEYEQYWLTVFIDTSSAGNIPPIAGNNAQPMLNILRDMYMQTNNSPCWTCKVTWWQQTVQEIIFSHGKQSFSPFEDFNVIKTNYTKDQYFLDSPILSTLQMSKQAINDSNRLSWAQSGRYFEWISKFSAEAFGYNGAKSDLINLACVMAHENNMSQLNFDHERVAEPTTQAMLKYKLQLINKNTMSSVVTPKVIYHDNEFDDTISIGYVNHILETANKPNYTLLFAQVPDEDALESLCNSNPKKAELLCEYHERLKSNYDFATYGAFIEDTHCTNLDKVCKNDMLVV